MAKQKGGIRKSEIAAVFAGMYNHMTASVSTLHMKSVLDWTVLVDDTQEANAPSQHDRTVVDWDVIDLPPQNQPEDSTKFLWGKEISKPVYGIGNAW